MKSLFNLSAAVVAMVLSFPTATAAQDVRDQDEEAKEECEQICQAFPSQAPPGCVCTLINPGGTGGSTSYTIEDLLEMDAPEILAIERADYLARMEGIQDYWLIERSNIAPVPTVIPYERNAPGAWPPFRQVTQPELEQHWIDTDPNMSAEQRATAQAVADDPAGAVQGMGQAIGIFTEALAGQLPVGGDLVKEKAKGVAAAFDTAATEIAQDRAEDAKAQAGDALADLEAATEPIWASVRPVPGVYDASQPIGARKLVKSFEDPDWFQAEYWWENEDKVLYWPCAVFVYDGPAYDIDGADGVTYTITRAEKWIGKDRELNKLVPIYIRLEIEALTTAGFQRGVMHQESTRYVTSSGLSYPERVRNLFCLDCGGPLDELYFELKAVVNSYKVGGVNDGLPTQADYADTLGEAGLPGSGSAWP